MTITANPAKKATNITLSADVLADARQLGIDISQACDSYLREQERRWAQQHVDFIAAYNQTLETEGLPLEQWRWF